MKSKKPLRAALVSAAILAPSLAHAVVLSHDSFSGYTAGELATNNLPGQNPTVAGYSGPWTDVDFGDQEPSITVGSLVYSDPQYLGSTGDKVSVPVNPGGVEIEANDSGRVFRLLDTTLAVNSSTTGTLYLSFLYQNGQQTGATTFQMLSLYDTSTTDANRNFTAGLTTNGGQTGNQYNFGAENGTLETYASTGVAADTSVHLFVVKFDLSAAAGSDSVTVWLDPILGAGDPLGGTTISGKNLTWDRLALSDYEGNSAAWDEVRWGTDFNSVTTVPEPASALLGSFGILALLRRRRK